MRESVEKANDDLQRMSKDNYTPCSALTVS